MRLQEMQHSFSVSSDAILTLVPGGEFAWKVPRVIRWAVATKRKPASCRILRVDDMMFEFSTTLSCLATFGESTAAVDRSEEEEALTTAELEDDLNDLQETKKRYEALGSEGFLRYSDYRKKRSASR